MNTYVKLVTKQASYSTYVIDFITILKSLISIAWIISSILFSPYKVALIILYSIANYTFPQTEKLDGMHYIGQCLGCI